MRRTRSVPAFAHSTLEGLDDWDMLDLMPLNDRETAVQNYMFLLLDRGILHGQEQRWIQRNAYHELVNLVSKKQRAKSCD